MEGKPFYEPTQELNFIRNLTWGRFAIALLPTSIPELKRWQIFAFNAKTQAIDAWNIEQSKDGLFNTKGTLIDATGTLTPASHAAEFALSFNGTSYLELPNQLNSDTGTIELWLKFDTLDDQIIFDASTDTTNATNAANVVKYCFIDVKEQKLRFWLEDSQDNDYQGAVADLSQLKGDDWHHVAAVWSFSSSPDRSASTQLYLNGELVAQDQKPTGKRPILQNPFIGRIRNTSPLGQPGKSLSPFKGQIDEVRLWSIARSREAIAAGRNLLNGTELGLAGYWRLDEGSGSTVYDQTNNAKHGTLHGDVQWVKSTVALVEGSGISKTSVQFKERGIASGLSALLYFQQENAETGYDGSVKPLKRSARVMLVAATRANGSSFSEVAAIDFGVSREGKLAQVPDVLSIQPISRTNPESVSISQVLKEIAALEPQSRSLQVEVDRLQAAIALRTATVKLFSGENYQSLFQTNWLKPGDTAADGTLTFSSAQQIRSIAVDPGLKITFKSDKSGRSIELNASQGQQFSLPTVLGNAPFYRYTLTYTRAFEPDLINQSKDELQTRLLTVTTQLAVVQTDLDRLKAQAQGNMKLPMPLLSIDAFGLTTSGAVLDFAATDETPHLFDSANGNLILYFRGVNDQFFAAYYDTLTQRSTFTVKAGQGSVMLVARSGGPHMDNASVTIVGNQDLCTVTLESLGIKEVWTQVPRDAEKFTRILNGTASADPTHPFYYDYTQVSITGKPGSDPARGSLLFAAVSDTAGKVEDVALKGSSGKTLGAQWYANPPGNALQFDGIDDYVSLKAGQTPSQFDAEGDLTLEAWVKPIARDGDFISRLIEQQSEHSRYTMGLLREGEPSAIALDTGDSIVLSPSLTLPLSYTIEFWAKQPLGNPSDGLLWVKQDEGHAAPQALVVLNTEQLVAFPAWTPLRSLISSVDSEWHHWAYVCDASTFERVLYRDGQRVVEDRPQFPIISKAELWLGTAAASGGFKGTIDEIRFWNVARSARQINEAMNQRLSGSQSGQLIGCWRFDRNGLKDYSGNNHGVTQSRHRNPGPAGSAIAHYNLVAGVGNQVFTTTKRISANDWSHLAAVYNQAYALKFAGDAFLDCGNSPTLDINRDLTIEVFLKVDLLEQQRGILSKGVLDDGTGQNVPYALSVATDGKLVFEFEDTDHGNHTFTSTKAITPGIVYRVAVTRKYVTDTQQNPPKQWHAIRFYIGSRAANASTYTMTAAGEGKYTIDESNKDIGSSNQPLAIGKAYQAGAVPVFFQGTINEVRIWNNVRDAGSVCNAITGQEKGLISWWRFEENQGTIAYDSKSTNHATRTGTTWMADPDGSSIVLYCNGESVPLVASGTETGDAQFTLGALQKNGTLQDAFSGYMEEVRIWKVARSQEQIQDNLFRRLLGEQEDLIANYTFDAEANGVLSDQSFSSNHLALGQGSSQPRYVYSTAPIGDEIPQVRNALTNVRTPFQDVVHSAIAVQEYGDLQTDEEGNLNGILKRCYSFIQNGAWQLMTGFKVGNLIAEWVSQVQTAPQLIGFIEGAPPVPSENLTNLTKDYSGATSVALTEASQTMHTYSASRDKGFDMSVQASAALGLEFEAEAGFGVVKEIADLENYVGIKTTFENSLGWLDDASVGSGTQKAKTSLLKLQGSWEKEPLNSDIGKRFVPLNIGLALVQSETADVFALRLKHNHALVAFQMRPNPDIPKDWNILTFPMNASYIKQGTIDGKIGFANDPNYRGASDRTSDSSYFKPIEAYALKNRIVREEEELKAYFEQFEAGAIGRRQSAAQFSQGDFGKGSLLEKLPQFEKRNMVNTYVWTADGGFFAESEQTMDVRQEVTGGSYAFIGKAGVFADLKAVIMDAAVAFELEAMFGGHLNLTVTKTQDSATSFGLDVNLKGVEQDIYQRDSDGQVIMNETDPLNPEPKKQAGKVDAHRFMTFYLQPNVEHFDEFVNKVVDSRWLAQSNHPNAIALQEAVQNQKAAKDQDKSVPWRVLHRVTYRSRVLPEFPSTTAPSLEKAMIDLDITSHWQLIKLLEPFVKNKTSVAFNDAVRDAIATYLPELQPHTPEIIQSMRQYFQVPENV